MQYYIFTKAPLPMDIEFIVQDIYSLTRPQWKLATSLEEASKAFQLAIAQDQKNAGLDKTVDLEDVESEASSDDEGAEGDEILPEADGEEDSNSEDEDDNEIDVSVLHPGTQSTCILTGACNNRTLNNRQTPLDSQIRKKKKSS